MIIRDNKLFFKRDFQQPYQGFSMYQDDTNLSAGESFCQIFLVRERQLLSVFVVDEAPSCETISWFCSIKSSIDSNLWKGIQQVLDFVCSIEIVIGQKLRNVPLVLPSHIFKFNFFRKSWFDFSTTN